MNAMPGTGTKKADFIEGNFLNRR